MKATYLGFMKLVLILVSLSRATSSFGMGRTLRKPRFVSSSISSISSEYTNNHHRQMLSSRRYHLTTITACSLKANFASISSNQQRRSTTSLFATPTSTTPITLFDNYGSLLVRGGANTVSNLFGTAQSTLLNWNQSPSAFFNATLMFLAMLTLLTKLGQFSSNNNNNNNNAKVSISDDTDADTDASNNTKPAAVKSLQMRFLAVFWLLRMADWLQGPYFYEVYASKTLQSGLQVSLGLVSYLFLTGFASTAVLGPSVGRAADQSGRKKATLAFCVVYALGALSTKSAVLQVLFLGRILSGIGTSLLFSAPEAWLVSAMQKEKKGPEYLGETFGQAYAGDSIVAIVAGQLAGLAATQRGPTGPFELSTIVLVLGGLLTSLLWKENKATNLDNTKPSIREAVQVVKKDRKILLIGGVQSLFEAAMYIFVLQWPPAAVRAIQGHFGTAASVPYGTIFSCFMVCCLLGSTLFSQLSSSSNNGNGNGKQKVKTETSTFAMLAVATAAMTTAATLTKASSVASSLWGIMASFFVFEMCVGLYFPSIGTLRSKYIPDSHRGVIMNLFGIPLNVLVVSVFLSIQQLGISGALAISSGALAVATLCAGSLQQMTTSTENLR